MEPFVYHMTHVNNLRSILINGLFAHNMMVDQKINSTTLYDEEVMSLERTMFSKNIHEYVRFYLNPKNPMLYKRREAQNDIIMIKVRVQLIKELYDSDKIVVTDGNAAHRYTDRQKIDDLRDDFLDVECVYSPVGNWSKHEDGKRKRCAELMIDTQRFPSLRSSAIVVRNDITLKRVQNILKSINVSKNIELSPERYF